MGTRRTLTTNVNARTKNFRNGMKRSQTSLQKFTNSVKSSGLLIAKFGAAAGAVAAGGISVLTKRALNSIDVTAKLADRLGTTTEELQGLRLAAKISGSSSATLDKALEKLTKGIGEAQQNIGQAKFALEALGISVSDVINLNPAQQFSLFSDAISKLNTEEEKAAIATQLFGRSGVELLNTLNLGANELQRFQKEASQLGIAFDRVDAAKVEAANDSFTRLGSLIEGIGNQLAIQLSPFLEEINKRILAFGTSGAGVASKVIDAFEGIALGIAKTADFIDLGKAAFFGLAAVVGETIGASLRIIDGLGQAVEEVLNLIPGVSVQFDRSFKDLGDAFSQKAVENFDIAAQSFDNFLNDTAENSVKNFFNNIKANSTSAAEQIAQASQKASEALVKPALENVEKIVDESAKQISSVTGTSGGGAGINLGQGSLGRGSSRQINLSRTALSGVSRTGVRTTKITSPQIDNTNKILTNINRNLQNQVPRAS